MPDTAVISRGGTSVSVDLLGEPGDLAVARDIGKPTMRVEDVGREDPLTQDNFSAGDGFTFVGLLQGASAYTSAKTLAEDLIKPRATTGTPLQLDLSDLPNRGTYDVAPTTESACALTYVPGERNLVGVQATLSVVTATFGGDQDAQTHSSPDAGDGVKIERSGTSVTLTADVEVTRTVGRPSAEAHQRTGDLPALIDENAPAADVFEVSGEIVTNAASQSNTLEESIIRPRLGQDTLTLHFLGNLYGLDAYTVAPVTSQAVRTVFRTSEKGMVGLPTVQLRVVDNT